MGEQGSSGYLAIRPIMLAVAKQHRIVIVHVLVGVQLIRLAPLDFLVLTAQGPNASGYSDSLNLLLHLSLINNNYENSNFKNEKIRN